MEKVKLYIHYLRNNLTENLKHTDYPPDIVASDITLNLFLNSISSQSEEELYREALETINSTGIYTGNENYLKEMIYNLYREVQKEVKR